MDTGPFSVGEKVVVPHTDKFYEAKVQKAQKREDGLWYYFLHYLGRCLSHSSVLQACAGTTSMSTVATAYTMMCINTERSSSSDVAGYGSGVLLQWCSSMY